MERISRYFAEFGAAAAQGWNRFWFTPSDPLPLCLLRMAVGAAALLYFVLLTPDVTTWFTQAGMIPDSLYDRLVSDNTPVGRIANWTVFHHLTSSRQAMVVHMVSLAAATLLTLGCFSRASAVATFVMLLQYVHRAPFVMGQFEPVLGMLVIYLAIGPCGAAFSVDAWRRKSRPVERSWLATVSLRLIQVHLAMFYLMMGMAKLHGDIWWRGDGIWALMAMRRSALFDWSSWRNMTFVINFWTHLVVLYEITFVALIWNRWLRPLVIALGVLLWLLLMPVSGLFLFCGLMIAAYLAYIPAEFWKPRN